MLKKYERIIKKSLCPDKADLAKIGFVDGYYYAANGYVMVRCEERPNDLPIFGKSENHPNYLRYIEEAADASHYKVTIPYSPKQIRDWIKTYKKKTGGLRRPFNLGAMDSTYWVGINPEYLADALETTQTNEVWIPEQGHMILIQGNGFVWLIMPIALQGFEKDKHMTEIEVNQNDGT